MTSPKRDDGQTMLELGELDNGAARMVERAVRRALESATAEGLIDPKDVGAAALAAGLARAVDHGLIRKDPYAVATAGRELRDVLARLRLDPESRGVRPTEGDDLGSLLRQLADNDVDPERAT